MNKCLLLTFVFVLFINVLCYGSADKSANAVISEGNGEAVTYSEKYEGELKAGKDIPEGEYIILAKDRGVVKYEISGIVVIADNVQTNIDENQCIGFTNIEGVKLNIKKKDSGGLYYIEGNNNITEGKYTYNGYNTWNVNNISQKYQYFTNINFIGCYAVPADKVVKRDTSYNGSYRVGIDLGAGKYRFKKADGCDFGFVSVTGSNVPNQNRSYVISDFTDVELFKNSYIKIYNCDIYKNNFVLSTHKDWEIKNYTDLDFSEINHALKRRVQDDIRSISSKYKENYSINGANDMVNGWDSLVKNDADRKYVEIMKDSYDRFYKFAVYNRVISANEKISMKQRGRYLSDKEEEAQNNIKKIGEYLIVDFSSLAGAESFSELENICQKLINYVIIV
ncbi:MAG: hypothetical protein Q4D26_03325 [Clostridia bacterium]|nr:hypothetical protein [Clostridia bacterium]